MGEKTLISIIVPLYNKENYILTTLNSILEQTYHNFELLVVDDGSTDSSLAQLQKINDNRVVVIKQSNQGVSSARNNGIQHAKGEWVAFLDADDIWDYRFLEKMFALVSLYPEGEIFSSGRLLKFKDKSHTYSNPYLPVKGSSHSVDYLKVITKYLPPINSSSCLINKKLLIKSGGFKEGMKNYEDHELWIRISYNRPIYFLNEPLSIYRKDVDASSSGSKCSLRASDFKLYLETLINVKSNIDSPVKINNLEHYGYRFCKYNYLLNVQHYSSTEVKEIRSLMKKVVGENQYRSLFLITLINASIIKVFVNIYRKRKSR